MVETHQIIVVSTLKYSEDKLIVNALSRSAARVTLLVRIAHNQRAAVRHTLFQPLAMLEVQWESNPRVKMLKPKSARPDVPLLSVQTDPVKSTVAMFLAEFLSHVTRNEFEGGLLYDYIAYALQWYDAAEKDYANFHLVFLLRLTRFLGIEPNLDDPPVPPEGGLTKPHRPMGYAYHQTRGLYFDLQEGAYTKVRPAHAYYIEGADAAALPTLWRMNFGTMQVFRLSGTARSRILQAIITYYRLHLPGIPELKSLDVLREVFR